MYKIVSSVTGHNCFGRRTKALTCEQQSKFLSHLICGKWFKNGQAQECKKIKHGEYRLRKNISGTANIYLHCALVFWTTDREKGRLIIACKQPRSSKGLIAGGANGEIIKIPRVIYFSPGDKRVDITNPPRELLLKLDLSTEKTEYPFLDFIDFIKARQVNVNNLRKWPFEVPISYCTKKKCRRGHIMYHEGISIPRWINGNKQALNSIKAKLWFVLRLLYAVKIFHGAGFVHRDIKPKNFVIKGVGEQIKITLIDIEHIKKAGYLDYFPRGTLVYIAGEIMKKIDDAGEAWLLNGTAEDIITKRSDIYSLGLILVLIFQKNVANAFKDIDNFKKNKAIFDRFEWWCRYSWWKKYVKNYWDNLLALLQKSIDIRLCNIISKMVQENPKDRYQSIYEVIAEFEKFLG